MRTPISPRLKFALSAIATGVIAFLTLLTTSGAWDADALRAALAAAAAAILQYVSPLSEVGYGYQPTQVAVRLIPERRIPGRPLGRHVEHDPRSRRHAHQATGATLVKVLWHRFGLPLNQGQLGSCTGNALTGVLNTSPEHVAGQKLFTEHTAVSLYELATTLDNIPGQYPPTDTGSSGLAICKAAKQRGLIAGYKHAFTLADALDALQHGPVITGVNWYTSFDTPDPTGIVEITPGATVRGGHEFEVLGYDPVTDLVTAENSWGPTWGQRGRFRFTSKTWGRLLSEQGDVTIPVPKT